MLEILRRIFFYFIGLFTSLDSFWEERIEPILLKGVNAGLSQERVSLLARKAVDVSDGTLNDIEAKVNEAIDEAVKQYWKEKRMRGNYATEQYSIFDPTPFQEEPKSVSYMPDDFKISTTALIVNLEGLVEDARAKKEDTHYSSMVEMLETRLVALRLKLKKEKE